jgi:hypothetical protein
MGPLAGGGTTVVQPRHAKTMAPRPPTQVYGKPHQANDRHLASFGGLKGLGSFGYPQAHGPMMLAPFEGIATDDPCRGTTHVRRDRK